MVTEQGQDNM